MRRMKTSASMKIVVMSSNLTSDIISAIKATIGDGQAALHEPTFDDRDKAAMRDVIESGFVSSMGPHLEAFEEKIRSFTKAKHAIAVVNGTAALTLGLLASGVEPGHEVLIPALTFVATGNAIQHAGAIPHFIESDRNTLGVDVPSLRLYLERITTFKNGRLCNIKTGRTISAIMPVHVFGHIGDIDGLETLAEEFKLFIIEDAAEALGSFKHGKHAGIFGACGTLSFNGNKIITTGGGGAILTNDDNISNTARHLATTAKQPHRYDYFHDRLGYNFRMPALNAALGCSQMEKLDTYLRSKQQLNISYAENFAPVDGCDFMANPKDSQSNHWLNAIILNPQTKSQRNAVLDALNDFGYGSRPIWALLNTLPHFAECPSMPLGTAEDLVGRIINIPSSASLAERLEAK